jgi:hypothetical protein
MFSGPQRTVKAKIAVETEYLQAATLRTQRWNPLNACLV